MKIVIDIDENVFTRLFDNGVDTSSEDRAAIDRAVRNGTVLPKGHGALIDRDVAYDEFDKACCSYEGGLLKYIPPVIPADK